MYPYIDAEKRKESLIERYVIGIDLEKCLFRREISTQGRPCTMHLRRAFEAISACSMRAREGAVSFSLFEGDKDSWDRGGRRSSFFLSFVRQDENENENGEMAGRRRAGVVAAVLVLVRYQSFFPARGLAF